MILPFSKPVKLGQYEDTIPKGPKNGSCRAGCDLPQLAISEHKTIKLHKSLVISAHILQVTANRDKGLLSALTLNRICPGSLLWSMQQQSLLQIFLLHPHLHKLLQGLLILNLNRRLNLLWWRSILSYLFSHPYR